MDSAPAGQAAARSVAGQVLGRYELLLPIAKGGMAQVWAARLHGTRGFQKIVAIKTILAGAMEDSRMEEMFLEEATLASRIHHPNVVETLELGEQNGMLYLAMEWVDGESLGFIMGRAAESGGVPLPIAVNLVGQACKGLHAAHELRDDTGALLGVVHRDLSPHNLLVTHTGTVKVVDFGIAKATAMSSALTQAGEVKGKFAYMSPEQVTGGTIDRSSDIFAIGILLYLMTTGRQPFRGATAAETVRNVCALEPIAPSTIRSDYPRALEDVVLRALSKSSEKRWGSAHDLVAALENAVPEAFEGTFEARTADYLKEVLGPRPSERRAELKIAQELADRARAEGTSTLANPGSLSSLRAFSVEPAGATRASDVPSARVLSPVPESDLAVAGPAGTLVSSRSWPRRRGAWVAIGMVGAAFAGALAMSHVRSSNPSSSAGMVPANGVSPFASLPAPPARVPAASALPSAAGTEMHVVSALPSASAPSVREPVPPAARGRPARRGPPSAPQATAGPSTTSTTVVSDPERGRPVRSEDADKGSAWDLDSFGGRH